LTADRKTITFTPTALMPANTVITATVANVTAQSGGTPITGQTWSFTTAPATTVVSLSPANGATNVVRTVAPAIVYSAGIKTGATFTLKAGTTTIAGTTALSADAKTLTFTPSAALPGSTTLTATVSGAVGQEGTPIATQTWSFTTAAIPTQNLFGTMTPAGTSTTPLLSSMELGTAFVASVPGQVVGMRFYKASSSTGSSHTGRLWSSSGTQLASVSFSTETSSGWQTATFSSPITITAGTTYIVSYNVGPLRSYSVTSNFFTTAFTSGALTAPVTNGRTRNGSGFPSTTSSSKTNYFVDPVFRPAN
jgi:hypothetical protein